MSQGSKVLSPTAPTLVTGVSQVAGGRALWKLRQKQEEWPFPWIERPVGSMHVFQQGAIAAPTQGTTGTILTYTVDDGGFYFAPDGVVLFFQTNGAQGAYNPGDFTFALTVNSAGGGPNVLPYTYFQGITVCLGSPLQGEWPIKPGQLSLLKSRDQLSATVLNTNIVAGSPNFFVAIFTGWTWPIETGFAGS